MWCSQELGTDGPFPTAAEVCRRVSSELWEAGVSQEFLSTANAPVGATGDFHQNDLLLWVFLSSSQGQTSDTSPHYCLKKDWNLVILTSFYF